MHLVKLSGGKKNREEIISTKLRLTVTSGRDGEGRSR